MTNFDAGFDYLLLLGIDPAESLRNLPAVADLIKAKKKVWTSQALNPLYQQMSRANLERAREFEALLAEPAAFAAYVAHIKQARASRRGDQESALSLLIGLAAGGRKSLTSLQRDLIATEGRGEGIPDGLLDDVLNSRSIAIVPTRAAVHAEKPRLPVQAPALDPTLAADIQNWLKVLDRRSLYELLDLPNASPPARLVSQAQVLYYHWSKVLPKTNAVTAWEKTLQACLTYLKDVDSKARYDRSLFNQRIHRLATRIDLVLAGSDFGSDDQAKLVRLGVEDFGFSEAVVEKCIAARMAAKGISSRVQTSVTIQLQGQVRCRRCGAWNGPKLSHCRECASSLQRKCENPACHAPPMPSDAKVCPSCGLVAARGVQYRTLLRLADAFLDSGSHQAALSVCQRAAQILPGEAVDQRLARSVRVRELIASAKVHAAAQAWSAVRAVLTELLPLAPRVSIAGVPSLEKIIAFMSEATQKLREIPNDAGPVDTARACLACLRRWTDFDEAYRRIRLICMRFESDGLPKLASQLASRLLEIRPYDDDLPSYIQRLETETKRIEAINSERFEATAEYMAAVGENRLYSAERALHALETSPAPGVSPPGGDDLRRRLGDIRRELVEIKQLAAGTTRRDQVIDRYLDILSRCRDCREALLAVQSLPLDPPEPPEGLVIRREGNRRSLSWNPPASGRRTSYVVQRSMTRPYASRVDHGAIQVDPPFQSIYEGDALHINDDEVAHDGVILRYTVHAVARGRIEVEGSVVRTYEMSSQPASFVGVLIWQEVKNLKATRRDRALELSWYTPSGVRQVFIERWRGGPDDHGPGREILPATGPDHLLDEGLGEGMVYTYRISCLYDGPDGEFRSPGVCLTDGLVHVAAKLREAEPEASVPSPSSNGL